MKAEYERFEQELLDCGFKIMGVCPKRLYKIEDNRAMVYELKPARYIRVYDGIKDPIERWIEKNGE
jgi:hypothetical protein